METGAIKIIGGLTDDPAEKDFVAYIKILRVVQEHAAKKYNMTVGDSIAGTLTAVATIAEEYGFRDELAIVMEKWAELLRTSQPIHIRADQIGHA